MIRAYRIVEEKNGEYFSLFHGTNRSRKLPRGEWIKADLKRVRDGSRATYYDSGFHVLLSKVETEKFFKKLFKKHKDRKVIKVYVLNIHPKTHSRHQVFLAEQMYIPKDSIEELAIEKLFEEEAFF